MTLILYEKSAIVFRFTMSKDSPHTHIHTLGICPKVHYRLRRTPIHPEKTLLSGDNPFSLGLWHFFKIDVLLATHLVCVCVYCRSKATTSTSRKNVISVIFCNESNKGGDDSLQ